MSLYFVYFNVFLLLQLSFWYVWKRDHELLLSVVGVLQQLRGGVVLRFLLCFVSVEQGAVCVCTSLSVCVSSVSISRFWLGTMHNYYKEVDPFLSMMCMLNVRPEVPLFAQYSPSPASYAYDKQTPTLPTLEDRWMCYTQGLARI